MSDTSQVHAHPVASAIKRCLLAAGVTWTMSACDSGTWVDGTWAVGCEAQAEAKKADALGNDNFMTAEARAICRNAGKAFTGEFRCENGNGQVKCK